MSPLPVNRWFIRCFDCCAIAAVDRNPMERVYWEGRFLQEQYKGPKCSCGGQMQSMGRVKGNRLLLESDRCACDSRCTYSKGPNCDCVCQGANHGSGRIACVRVDNGEVPVVEAGSVERAEEFRRAIAEARERVKAMPFAADFAAGTWIPRDAWEAIRAANNAISRARSLKSHAGRMKVLASIAAPRKNQMTEIST